jgi:hypothetical protein
MRESSDEDFGVRDVAGFVMMEEEEVRREDVQGMELKKVSEEVREGGGDMIFEVGRGWCSGMGVRVVGLLGWIFGLRVLV